MINNLEKESNDRMVKVLDNLNGDLKKLRTGRANPDLLNSLKVDYYGTETPITQVASVAVSDSRTLMVTPWEKSILQAIEKSIIVSELGLNPVNLGSSLKIPLPPLTQERRKDLIKIVKNYAEQSKVAIRNLRRDANNKLKLALKSKEITQDQERQWSENIQKLTDSFVKKVDSIVQEKESELMQI